MYIKMGTQALQFVGPSRIAKSAINWTLIPKIIGRDDPSMYNHAYIINNDSEPNDDEDEGILIIVERKNWKN